MQSYPMIGIRRDDYVYYRKVFIKKTLLQNHMKTKILAYKAKFRVFIQSFTRCVAVYLRKHTVTDICIYFILSADFLKALENRVQA